MKMRKYYKNFLSFNGHPHIVNFIQIDISLYLISFSSEHTHNLLLYRSFPTNLINVSHKY